MSGLVIMAIPLLKHQNEITDCKNIILQVCDQQMLPFSAILRPDIWPFPMLFFSIYLRIFAADYTTRELRIFRDFCALCGLPPIDFIQNTAEKEKIYFTYNRRC